MTSPDICARPPGLHDSDSSFLLPNLAASLLTGEALSKLAAFSIVASTVQTGEGPMHWKATAMFVLQADLAETPGTLESSKHYERFAAFCSTASKQRNGWQTGWQ